MFFTVFFLVLLIIFLSRICCSFVLALFASTARLFDAKARQLLGQGLTVPVKRISFVLVLVLREMFLLGVVDSINNRVEAWGSLSQEAWELGEQRGQDAASSKLTDHGHEGIGRPGQQPETDVGDGYLGNADLSTFSILVLLWYEWKQMGQL